jgi:hypothetical protein
MNSNENELYHYGILGQKWGVRRYQNPDGSLTPEGRRRYNHTENGKDVTAEAGTQFHRLSLSPIERQPGVRKYVTVDKTDKKWEDLFKKAYKGDTLFKHTYEAIKDVKIASIPSVRQAYKELADKDPEFREKAKNTIRQHREWTGVSSSGDDEMDFYKALGVVDPGTRTFYDYMVAKGYDAVADIYGVMSNSPTSTILLNPDNTVRLIKSIQI